MGLVYIIGSLAGAGILFYGWLRLGRRGEAVYLGAGRLLYKRLPRSILQRIEDIKNLRLFRVATKDALVQEAREHAIHLLGISISLFTLFQALGAGVSLKELLGKQEEAIYLERDDYDGEEIPYHLFVTLEGDNMTAVTLPVSERTYGEEELSELFEQSYKEAWEQILGDNKDYTAISQPLCVIRELPDSPVDVNLWWEEEHYISEEGELLSDAFEDGTQMLLYLELSYQGEKRQQQMPIILKKPVYNKSELVLQRVKDTLSSLEGKDTTSEVVEIPTILHGASISVEEASEPISLFFLVSVLIPALLWLKSWQDEQEKKALRSRQLSEDYPKLLYKMVLYLGAGITMKGCFEAINREWEGEQRSGDGDRVSIKQSPRYLQMEIYALVQQLGMGIPELTCYEEWGRQLNEPQYLRLANIIMKNMSKGSEKLLSIMKQERSLALREHREQVKKRGEEASTKLLFPMLLLLLTAMLIVLIPAFFQFM